MATSVNLPHDSHSPAPTGESGEKPLRLTVPLQSHGRVVLQVVVVWRGTIIGYRLLNRRRKISVGRGKGATFVSPQADARAKFMLLKPRRDGYLLRLTPALRGEPN